MDKDKEIHSMASRKEVDIIMTGLLILVISAAGYRLSSSDFSPMTAVKSIPMEDSANPVQDLNQSTEEPFQVSREIEAPDIPDAVNDQSTPRHWYTLTPGQSWMIELPNGARLVGRVERVWDIDDERHMNATVSSPMPAMVGMKWSRGGFAGTIQSPRQNLAYVLSSEGGGELQITEMLLSELICAKPLEGQKLLESGTPVLAGIPRPTNEVPIAMAAFPPPSLASVPVLRSRPVSGNVIYLDFDGETVTDSAWNNGSTIVAAPARLTDSQIQEVWRRVVADFEVFDVNVTTQASDYTNATPGRRTHVIITPTDTAAPGAGGVAYIGSFAGLYSRYCWAFIDTEAKACAEVISHEAGHTLGLFHDGRTSPAEEYYAGHGSGPTGWAPIMGVGYYRELTQWSKGEYPNANNSEDDLAVMSGLIPYLADDHGATTGTATAIIGSTVDGRTERNTDNDMFSVSLTSGAHTIYLQPANYGNLDAVLEVLNSGGGIIATSNPPNLLSATASFNLASPQNVYLRVRGTGKPAGDDPGYTGYSSLGSYTLFGFGDQQQPPSAPFGLTIKRISGSQLQLSWQVTLGATNYLVYRNGDFWTSRTNTVVIDKGLTPSTTYSYVVRAENGYGLSNPSEPAAISTPTDDEFIMDGESDFASYLVSSPGMVIHVAVRGSRLYVSTWSPGSDGAGFGSDHHLFVSDTLLPAATTPAPWAKRGLIAIPGNKPYLAGESTTTYAGWFNTSGGTTLFKPPVNSLQMEGSIDLLAEFGAIPEYIYVASVAYQTEDADLSDIFKGRINAQAPAAVIANDNLEPQEFLQIPIASIRDTSMDGIYDVLSPDYDFRIHSLAANTNDQPVLNWRSAPGGSYRIMYSSNLMAHDWQLIGVRSNSFEQWGQSFTDTNAPAMERYYLLEIP